MDDKDKLIDEQKEKIKELKDALENQSKIIKENKPEIEKLQNGFYVPKSEFYSLHEAYKTKENEVNDLVLQIDELKGKLDLANTKIELLQDQVSHYHRETQQKVSEIGLKDKRIQDLMMQINDYDALHVKTKNDQLVYISEKKQLADTIARYEAHIEDLDNALKDMMKQVRDLNQNVEERDKIIGQIENDLQEERYKNELLELELSKVQGLGSVSPNAKQGAAQAATLSATLPSGTQSVGDLQKQLIEAKNKVNFLTIQLNTVQKEAERAHQLQYALEQRNREYENLQRQCDQKELELQSDRKVLEIYGQQINGYRVQIETIVDKANEQYQEFSRQVKFYKDTAVEIGNEKEKLQKEIDKKQYEIEELNKEITKLESKEYGLTEAVMEIRTLKSIVTQRQTAIVDYIFQIKFYEAILAKLESEGHLPEGFNYEEFVKRVANEIEGEEKDEADTQAVKIMSKAIARHQNKQNTIELFIDQETTIAPPSATEDFNPNVKPFTVPPSPKATMSATTFSPPQPKSPRQLDQTPRRQDVNFDLPLEEEKSIEYDTPDPNRTMGVLPNFTLGVNNLQRMSDMTLVNNRTLDPYKLQNPDKTFNLPFGDTTTTLGPFDATSGAVLSPQQGQQQQMTMSRSIINQSQSLPRDLKLQLQQQQMYQTRELQQSTKPQESSIRPGSLYPNEINDLYTRLGLFQTELMKAQQQNAELQKNVEYYKQMAVDQGRVQPSGPASGSSKTEASPSISPMGDAIQKVPQNVPPMNISSLESGNSSEQDSEGPTMGIAISAEVSSDDDDFLPAFMRNSTVQSKAPSPQTERLNSPLAPRILSRTMPLEVVSFKPPPPKLASDMCTMSGIINKEDSEPVKIVIANGFDGDAEEIQKPFIQVSSEKKSNIAVLTTRDDFIIYKAKVSNHKESIEKLQRKASSRKRAIKELQNKAKQQEEVNHKLQESNSTLQEEMNKQREQFQERLLQMRNETDRYLELEKEEMQKGVPFMQSALQREEDEKKSKELLEVSRLLQQLKNDKQQLEISLDEARDTSKYMQKRNHELTQQIKMMEEELSSRAKPQETQKSTDFQAYAKKLKGKLNDLQMKYDDLNKEHEALKRKKVIRSDIYGVEINENAVDDLTPRNSARGSKTEKTPSSAHQSSVEALKLKKLTIQLDEANVRNGELQALLARQTETNKRLQKLLQAKETTTMQMQAQIASLKQQIVAQKRKNVTK